MATKKTMQERLEAWSADVAAEYIDPDSDPLEELSDEGGPAPEVVLEMIEWSNNAGREVILFTLALCVSEVVRRYGVDATQTTLEGLLSEPSIYALGEIVHAGQVVEMGGMPEKFAAEDLEEALRTKLDTDDTGEEL